MRATVPRLNCYSLKVIGVDAYEIASSAGGWVHDRIRAGWHVSVDLQDTTDSNLLRMLGIRPEAFEQTEPTLWGYSSVAISARACSEDAGLEQEITRAIRVGQTEVCLWGDPPPPIGNATQAVRHHLSSAAYAFKHRALAALGDITNVVTGFEYFQAHAVIDTSDGTKLTECDAREHGHEDRLRK